MHDRCIASLQHRQLIHMVCSDELLTGQPNLVAVRTQTNDVPIRKVIELVDQPLETVGVPAEQSTLEEQLEVSLLNQFK